MFKSSFITESKDAFFHYVNASGVVSAHCVVQVVEKDNFLQGYSVTKRGYRTFLKDRIMEMFHTEADLNGATLPTSDVTLAPCKNVNTKSSLDICFTGFKQADKQRLTTIAKENNLTVRGGVTANLYFLCVGDNKGWRKIQDARKANALIVSEQQFLEFINTGEIPYKAPDIDSLYATKMSDEVEDLGKMLDELSMTFRVVREPRRSTALIANFIDGYAAGWRFAIKPTYREALDIKKTKITFEKNTYESWTQGTSYQFHRGDVFYSDRLGYEGWDLFLKLPKAVVLQVKYECFSGYETIGTFDGTLTGSFIPSRRLMPKEMTQAPILFEAQSYDPGTITLDVLIPDSKQTKLQFLETITMTQDDFIGLLQTGCYWKKTSGEPAQFVDLFDNDRS